MLTKRALLNVLAGVLDQTARVLVGFFVTPILVSQLGPAVFGIWQVIQKASTQLGAIDGRSPEVLKWHVANEQNSDDDISRQQAVGSAVLCFASFLPLLLIVGGLWIYFLPDYLGLAEGQVAGARLAAAVMLGNALLLTSAGIFEATIRGMNLAYKLIGVLSVILITGGIVTAMAATQGYGIVGIASAQLLVGGLSLIAYGFLARRHIQWLGLKWPTRTIFKQAFSRSKWFTAWGFINTLILAGDVLLLGALVSAAVVSQYVLTMYASLMITVAVLTAVSSALPGIGGLIGNGEKARADGVLQESLLYSWLLSVVITATVIAFNGEFIQLWVGPDAFAGHFENLLISLSVLQLVFIRHDAFVMNLALDIRAKVKLGALSLIITLLLALLFVPFMGIVGMSLALILGRLLLSVMYPRIVRRFLDAERTANFTWRQQLIAMVVLAASYSVSQMVWGIGWLGLLLHTAVYGALLLVVLFFIGLNGQQRHMFYQRFGGLIKSRGK
jgi:O-antigen/teichoic acid export membrane protein